MRLRVVQHFLKESQVVSKAIIAEYNGRDEAIRIPTCETVLEVWKTLNLHLHLCRVGWGYHVSMTSWSLIPRSDGQAVWVYVSRTPFSKRCWSRILWWPSWSSLPRDFSLRKPGWSKIRTVYSSSLLVLCACQVMNHYFWFWCCRFDVPCAFEIFRLFPNLRLAMQNMIQDVVSCQAEAVTTVLSLSLTWEFPDQMKSPRHEGWRAASDYNDWRLSDNALSHS